PPTRCSPARSAARSSCAPRNRGCDQPDAVTRLSPAAQPPHAVIARAGGGDGWLIAVLDSPSAEVEPEHVPDAALVQRVRALEDECAPRWTIRTLRSFYPPLLAAGVRLRRAHDLLLCHAILRDTAALAHPLPASELWVRADDLGE